MNENLSLEEMQNLIREDAYNIRNIKNSPEEIQLEAVRQNGCTIQYIESPAEIVKLEAVKQDDAAYVDRIVKLSDEEMNRYLEFERKSYMDFIEGEVTAASAAALTNKLLQYS